MLPKPGLYALLFFVVQLFFIVGDSQSQPALRFTRYSADDGLAYNLIDDLVQDKYGYIWMATPSGAIRFNGLDFESIHTRNGSPISLEGGQANCLALDKSQQLWVGTHSGLKKYDYNTKLLTDWPLRLPGKNPGTLLSVFAIAFESDSICWTGTDQGLFRINLINDQQRHWLPDQSANALLDQDIRSLLVDTRGYLWVGSRKGVTKYRHATGEFTQVTMNSDFPNLGIAGEVIRDIMEDGKGNIWIAAAGSKSGITKYDFKTGQFHNYLHDPDNAASIVNSGVFSIEFDDFGRLWAGTDAGLEILDTTSNVFTHIRHEPLDDQSISLDIVMEVIKDKHGRMWLGTFGGLSIWDPYEKQFYNLGTGENKKKNLPHRNVKSLARSVNNALWIGMDGGGFSYFDIETSAFTNFEHHKNSVYAPSSNKVLTLLEDGAEGLWIGYWNKGLDYFDLKTGKFRNYLPVPGDDKSLSGRDVFGIYKDSRDQLWVASWNGLSKMEIEAGKTSFLNFVHREGDSNSLISNAANCIVEDIVNDQLFIGTEKGLSVLDLKTYQFHSFNAEDSALLRTGFMHVNDLFRDSKDNIWICTSSGLLRYQSRERVFSKIIGDAFNINLDLQAIKEDLNGNYWVSSKNGLNQLYQVPTGWRVNHYTKTDGLHGNDFNSSAAAMPREDLIVFGGLNGLTYFDPAAISNNSVAPEVYIEKIDLYDASEIEGESFPFQTISLLDEQEVYVPAKASMFTIAFIALNYTDPERNKYKYKLEGFQDSWHDVSEGRSVSFTNLDPGSYTFRVVACNNDGLWNMDGAALQIEVLPPWWKTPAAYLVFAVLIGLIFFGTMHLRTNNLRRSRLRLINEVDKRTAEIKKQNEALDATNYLLDEKVKEIETQNEEISAQLDDILVKNDFIASQNKEINEKNVLLSKAYQEREEANSRLRELNANLEHLVEERTNNLSNTLMRLEKTSNELNTFLYRSSHDLKGPLSTLVGLSMLVKKEFENQAMIHYSDMVEGTSRVMMRNLKKLQQVHMIFNKTLSPEEIQFDSIKKSLLNFLNETDKKGLVKKEIVLENPADEPLVCDREILQIILENIAENAVFYCCKTSPYVKILLKIDEKSLSITIEDNGLGISSAEKDRIFGMFFRGKENSKGAGLGLYIAKSAVDKLKGEIFFQSANEKTIFEVKLKCPMTI
ncbi:MAG: GHKL domain-containing protein [Cyclobacteriaceae bacterium]|nr:GHKL domain-containing protein [Cyclobacteriaceae bacterium]